MENFNEAVRKILNEYANVFTALAELDKGQSSSGKDSTLSRYRVEFDPPLAYHNYSNNKETTVAKTKEPIRKLYKCPRCGNTRFTFLEYKIAEVEINGCIVHPDGTIEDVFDGSFEIGDDTKECPQPYRCTNCYHCYDADDLKKVKYQ